MIKITGASLILTENCNLNCSYCYESSTRNCNNVMSKEVAEKAIDFLASEAKGSKDKLLDITLFGGEPTLELELMEFIIDYSIKVCAANDIKSKFKLVTNGTLYTDEYEEKILKKLFTTPNVKAMIQISIDGTPEQHDKHRIFTNGKGSSAIVEKNIAKYIGFFKENDIDDANLVLHSVITPDNIDKIFNSYLYVRNLGIKSYWTLPLIGADWTDELAAIYEEQQSLIADHIYNKCIAESSNDDYMRFFNFGKISDCHAEKACGAGYNFITINGKGDIYPCHRFYFHDSESEKLGNVFEGFTEVETRQIYLDYTKNNMIGDKSCSQCTNTECRCCLAENKFVNGNILLNPPLYCKISTIDQTIKINLRNKMIAAGLLVDANSCNCGGNHNATVNHEELARKLAKEFTPVFTNLDKHIEEIRSMYTHTNERINLLDEKITTILELMASSVELMLQLNNNINKSE